ncbi:unnamed protein product [Aphanomyces euteiches]|uniref:Uncharacterized protein n=1 Tax=Aphanomyces euteiches TaxID=100861 RepID=A0A6G0WCD1_9STRA|nr:hypothetical protein Ae201684_017223 [Aphanomyces euteiches]KAH9100494.1 hypothetical protein Ae201684P_006691 [Aphanomyces euteiches]KAH9142699.1 hypothetical protein AeRB84_013248 [Aphanomyces euteiches]
MTLCPSLRVDESSESYEAILKYYSKAKIGLNAGESVDVAWLQEHLNPMATLEWTVYGFPDDIEDNFFNLPIARLHVKLDGEVNISEFKKTLPRLSHLKSLRMLDHGEFVPLEEDEDETEDCGEDYHKTWHYVLQFAAKNDQLSELDIYPEFHARNEVDLVHLTEWLRRPSARVFSLTTQYFWAPHGFGMDDDGFSELDDAVKQTFYQAMFNSPLERLTLTGRRLQDMDMAPFTCSMKVLQLIECGLRDGASETLIQSIGKLKCDRFRVEISQ